MTIGGLTFKQTCSASPEQYDVFDNNGNQVGYVRLRWGYLCCEYPDCDGEVIYESNVGDGFTGRFESEGDRLFHLTTIAGKILQRINGNTENND